MAAFTFLTNNEQNKLTSNITINNLLKEVREITYKNWQIIEKITIIKRLFRKDLEIKRYELYVEHEESFPPFQYINFYKNNTNTSLNFSINDELIISYLNGILTGVNIQKF